MSLTVTWITIGEVRTGGLRMIFGAHTSTPGRRFTHVSRDQKGAVSKLALTESARSLARTQNDPGRVVSTTSTLNANDDLPRVSDRVGSKTELPSTNRTLLRL